MQEIQLNPEEMRKIEFGFNPDDKKEVETRDRILKSINLHISEINSKLEEIPINKLNMEIIDKKDLEYIRNHIIELAVLKDNVELTLSDIKKIDDRVGNFVMCLKYLDRESQPDSFFQKVKDVKKILDKQLREGIESDKGYTIH